MIAVAKKGPAAGTGCAVWAVWAVAAVVGVGGIATVIFVNEWLSQNIGLWAATAHIIGFFVALVVVAILLEQLKTSARPPAHSKGLKTLENGTRSGIWQEWGVRPWILWAGGIICFVVLVFAILICVLD